MTEMVSTEIARPLVRQPADLGDSGLRDSSDHCPSDQGPIVLKVLQLIPTLDRSGAEKQMVMLAKGLPRDRFRVEVAALTRSARSRPS